MAQIAKKIKRYPSDLTDEEWARIAPLMSKPGRRGRPREVDFREVINGVRGDVTLTKKYCILLVNRESRRKEISYLGDRKPLQGTAENAILS